MSKPIEIDRQQDQGVAFGPGCQPSASDPNGSSQSGIPNAVWLIWATEGEYSDRSEWPIAVALDQATGEQATERLGQLWRELIAIYARREDDLDEAGDYSGQTLFEDTPEGREYVRLSGYGGGLGGCYAEDRSFTCSEVRVLTASGIEAPSGGETGTGSTVGESPAPEGGDAQ